MIRGTREYMEYKRDLLIKQLVAATLAGEKVLLVSETEAEAELIMARVRQIISGHDDEQIRY